MAKSGIHIKKENRGKFTATKKRTGKTTEELTHSKNPLTRKRAIFAQNAAKWKKAQDGLVMPKEADFVDPEAYYAALDEYNNQMAYLQQLNELTPIGSINPLSKDDKLQTSTSKFQDANNQIPSVYAAMQTSGRDLSKPSGIASVPPKKTPKWGDYITAGLGIVDALIPNGEIKDPVVFPKKGYNPRPYGTGSQAIAKNGKKMQNGGLFTTNKPAFADSVLNANKNLNFVQRYQHPNDYPVIKNPDGSYSTHLMASSDNFSYPTIVQDSLGKLIKMDPKTAYEYAIKNKQYIQFPNEEQANWFSANGYKQGKHFENGGDIPISTTGYKSNSKDKNEPKLRIPSNSITMKGVPHLVIATDSNGVQKVMMPGEDYLFPNAEYVDEQPLKKGGKVYLSKSYEKGGALSPDKAKEMLKDGTAHGKKLTIKQRQYFGMVAAGKAHNGMEIENNDYQHLSNDTLKLTGASHDNGGQLIQANGKTVEAEGGETMHRDAEGNVIIGGNLENPLTGRKFKEDFKMIGKKEAKVDKLMSYSTNLLKTANPYDKWDRLKFNAGEAMMKGAKIKGDQLSSLKEHLSDLQEASIALKEHTPKMAKNGLKIPKAQIRMIMAKKQSDRYQELLKKGVENLTFQDWVDLGHIQDAQKRISNTTVPQTNSSISVDKKSNLDTQPGQPVNSQSNPPGLHSRFQEMLNKMLADAPDYVKAEGYNIFSGYRDKAKQQALWDKSDKTGKWVAAPGKSEHEYGLAADLQNKEGKRIGKTGNTLAEKWIHDNAPKYGLQFRMGHEPWHISLKSDYGDNQWTGDFHPENYDTNPNNNIPVRKRAKYSGPFNPNGVKTEDISAAEFTLPRAKGLKKDQFGIQTPQPILAVQEGKYDSGLQPIKDIPVKSDAKPLQFNQILPEIYAAATNREEPVWLQQYNPQLYQPYSVSFQDRRNQITSQGRATRQYLQNNANAQAVLAAQEYDAINNTDAEEFRQNQQIAEDITNKNIGLLNESQLTNLKLADTQYGRQATAKSKTKAANQDILNSISNKVLQNKLENRTLQVYENLYPHYRYDESYKLQKVGNPGSDYINPLAPVNSLDNTTEKVTYGKDGEYKSRVLSIPGSMDLALKANQVEDMRNPLMKSLLKRINTPNLQGSFRKGIYK